MATSGQKERSMNNVYEIRVEYDDDTFEVVQVSAPTMAEANLLVRDDPQVVTSTVLAILDRQPQQPLAFG